MIILSSLTIRFFFCIFNYPSEPPNNSSQAWFLIKTYIVSSLKIPSKATRQIRVSPKNPCEIENARHNNPRDYNSYTARFAIERAAFPLKNPAFKIIANSFFAGRARTCRAIFLPPYFLPRLGRVTKRLPSNWRAV
jgi:hypothetical protein